MENIFTSTGIKLLSHPQQVAKFMEYKLASPISIQIAPTSRCNLNCCFCSNTNREKHEDLGLDQIQNLLQDLSVFNLRAVEWTGGGDPTMYHSINEAIEIASDLSLDQGLITNGLELSRLSERNLSRLAWLRISMNCLDYVEEIKIPKIKGTLGFSYVWNEKTTGDVLKRFHEHTAKYKPAYVRIVPNCQATDEEQDRNNKVLAGIVGSWGHPYFYQAKRFSKPKRCWWGYFKPFILHDSWCYPCSSVVLNLNADRKFHEKYRWVRMEDLRIIYYRKAVPMSSDNCDHCVFRTQNDIVDGLVNPNGMENFI